jgi:hypothetical protein
MNTPLVDMITNRIDLTLELRSADGTSTEFYQADEERIRKTLRSLANPRLLTQPQLVLASDHGVNVVPVRGVDMILARTSAQSPPIFSLIFPAGLLDITEVGDDVPDDDFGEEHYEGDSQPPIPLVSHVKVQTLGGWTVALKILATTGTTLHDQRQWFAHFMNLPVVAFRLQNGGIGLINPNNVTRVSAYPTPDGVPETTLPMDLLRWTPSRIKPPPIPRRQFIHENEN